MDAPESDPKPDPAYLTWTERSDNTHLASVRRAKRLLAKMEPLPASPIPLSELHALMDD